MISSFKCSGRGAACQYKSYSSDSIVSNIDGLGQRVKEHQLLVEQILIINSSFVTEASEGMPRHFSFCFLLSNKKQLIFEIGNLTWAVFQSSSEIVLQTAQKSSLRRV